MSLRRMALVGTVIATALLIGLLIGLWPIVLAEWKGPSPILVEALGRPKNEIGNGKFDDLLMKRFPQESDERQTLREALLGQGFEACPPRPQASFKNPCYGKNSGSCAFL